MPIRSIKDYIIFGWQIINFRRINFELNQAKKRSEDIKSFSLPEKMKCLDLANGNLRPQSYILKTQGHELHGVDICNKKELNLTNSLYSLIRLIFKMQLFIKKGKFAHDKNIIYSNVETLPYEDNSFDLITSVAAFEHFLNPEKVIKECKRVLKPNGIAWISLHSFTSITGGHNLQFYLGPVKKIPKDFEPWDHLRKNKVPIHVPLNKLRKIDYIELFKRYFKLENYYCYIKEGEEFLTDEIRKELSMYSNAELIQSTLIFILKNEL